MAPLKIITILRIELLAAVIGVRTLNPIKQKLGCASMVSIVWLDSRYIISRLEVDDPGEFPEFMTSRVREIQSSKYKYRYVPSTNNPADAGLRKVTSDELLLKRIGWEGLSWLSGNSKSSSFNDQICLNLQQLLQKAKGFSVEKVLVSNTLSILEELSI